MPQVSGHHRSSSRPTLSTSNWAYLPEDILDEIMKKMCYADFSTLGAVCKSWRLMCMNRFCCFSRSIPIGAPILLLNDCYQYSNSRKFVKMNGELARHKIFMPEAANKWVCGSSWGWLVLGGIDSMEVSLLNPLTRRVIRLPPVGMFTKRLTYDGEPNIPLKGSSYIHKAILSTNPTISEQDCIIMAIVEKNRRLSYCRIGDKKWTNVEGYIHSLSDIIYYEGKFYCTTSVGILMSFNIIDPNSTEMVTLGLSIDRHDFSRKYLVMASGSLLLVYRTQNYKFRVHSLNKCSQRVPPALCHHLQYEWTEIDSIGDQLLFIGNNDSFSLPTRRQSGKANCIYFTEHAFGMVQSDFHNNFFGMYDIAKKSTWLFNGNAENEPFPSFWITPTPW
ncbi:putative F-box protein At5g55150 [Carex rostrata]